MNEYMKINQNQSEVEFLLDERIPTEMDWWDSAESNYERFLEHVSNLWYEMPVDSEAYFDFRNEIYWEIARQLHKFQAQCPDDNSPFYLD